MKSASSQIQAFVVAAVLLVAVILVLVPMRPQKSPLTLSCVFNARIVAEEASNQPGSKHLVFYATMIATDPRTPKKFARDCHKMVTKRYRVDFRKPARRHRNIKPGQQLLIQLRLSGNHGLTGLQPVFEWRLVDP